MAKVKMKSKSAARKRFSKVGGKSGVKIKRAKAYRRHLLTKKNRKRKRGLRETAYVNKADAKRIRKLLPY